MCSMNQARCIPFIMRAWNIHPSWANVVTVAFSRHNGKLSKDFYLQLGYSVNEIWDFPPPPNIFEQKNKLVEENSRGLNARRQCVFASCFSPPQNLSKRNQNQLLILLWGIVLQIVTEFEAKRKQNACVIQAGVSLISNCLITPRSIECQNFPHNRRLFLCISGFAYTKIALRVSVTSSNGNSTQYIKRKWMIFWLHPILCLVHAVTFFSFWWWKREHRQADDIGC